MTRKHEGQFVALQGAVVMGKSDAAIKLWVTLKTFFEAGHSDEDDADARAIEDISDMFQSRSASSMTSSSI